MEKKAQRICAKLQTKLIYKGKWTATDRRRWDKVIAILLAERLKKSR